MASAGSGASNEVIPEATMRLSSETLYRAYEQRKLYEDLEREYKDLHDKIKTCRMCILNASASVVNGLSRKHDAALKTYFEDSNSNGTCYVSRRSLMRRTIKSSTSKSRSTG